MSTSKTPRSYRKTAKPQPPASDFMRMAEERGLSDNALFLSTLDGTVPIYRGKLITDVPVVERHSRWEQFLKEYPPEETKPRGFTGKKVMCLATGEIYPSIAAAAKTEQKSYSTMFLLCSKGEGWVKVDNANAAQT